MKHDHDFHHPHGFQVCARLVAISQPFDAGSKVELKYEIAHCHGLHGGALELLIPAGQATHYMLGDEISVRIRPL